MTEVLDRTIDLEVDGGHDVLQEVEIASATVAEVASPRIDTFDGEGSPFDVVPPKIVRQVGKAAAHFTPNNYVLEDQDRTPLIPEHRASVGAFIVALTEAKASKT